MGFVRCVTTIAISASLSLVLVPSGEAQAKFTKPVTKSPTGKAAPKGNDAREAIRKAIDACKSSMTAHPTPATADEDAYQTYSLYREWMDKFEPGTSSYDASIDAYQNLTPSTALPPCDKYFNDYATGVGATDLPLSQHCEGRARPFLKHADTAFTEYQASLTTKGRYPGRISDVRSRLASAHIALFTKYERPVVGRCATNDKFKKAFAPLKEEYNRLDALIVKEETAKGVKYVVPPETPPNPNGVGNSWVQFIYVDLKTGVRIENPRQ